MKTELGKIDNIGYFPTKFRNCKHALSNTSQVPAPPADEDEGARRARVRRRWRVLGMKIKFGLGAQALAVKRRNLLDATSFIDKESEVMVAVYRYM